MQKKTYPCPLCIAGESHLYQSDKRRDYFQCEVCSLIHVPATQHLSQAQEKAEYDLHQNDPSDVGYRAFLSRTLNPLLKQITQASQQFSQKELQNGQCKKELQGLDFGCGPGPCISQMAKEQGVTVNNYDLYYFNQPALLEKQYDFVTMTEVIEHIALPEQLLKQLDSLLFSSAILAIMTKRATDKKAFASWHYKNDLTHICFYSIETFQWIAQKMSWRLEIIDKDVVFFHKS